MKKHILSLFIVLLFVFNLVGCQNLIPKEDKKLNFDISKSFNLIKEEINDKNIKLTVRGNDDIHEYVNELKNEFKDENLTFNIYVYSNEERDFEFGKNEFENFRCEIKFNVNDIEYSKYEYITIPSNLNTETMVPFVNKNVEQIENKITCYIEIDNKYSLSEIVSTCAVYKEQVKKLNDSNKEIKIIVNDIYLYENSSYIAKTEKINF